MKIETRQLVLIVLGIIAAVIVYIGRPVLMPFFLAGIFAYLLNPAVSFLTSRFKLPRTLSIVLIYVVLIGLLAITIVNVSVGLARESDDFAFEARNFIHQTNSQINTLPTWAQPVALDIFESIRSSLLLPNRRISTYLPGALDRTLSALVFLVATFYFLKDGHYFINGFMELFPKSLREEIQEIFVKINRTLGNYLRGQLLLMIIMSVFTYIGLSLIGVRYALILSIFTGFAEIVPFVGPIAAAVVAMIVAFTDQASHISQIPLLDVVAVASLYTILRQLEDLFIIPQVMGKVTKLHPLVILFSVLAGGHFFGVIGYLIAVPFVASLRIVLAHIFDHLI